MNTTWPLLLAQVDAETRLRLRSRGTLIAALVIFAATLAWIPDPAKKASSISWHLAGDERTLSGLYTAAYVGTASAVLAACFLPLVGFYLVAGSVRRDAESRLGLVLAATPLSNAAYLGGKVLAHAAYLHVLGALAFVSGLVAFLRFGEGALDAAAFTLPFVLIVPPALLSTAAAAVLCDVTPGLRGRGGLVAWFFLWAFGLLVIPALLAGGVEGHGYPFFDPCGMVAFTQAMAASVPGREVHGVSMGIQFHPSLERVPWSGLPIGARFVSARALALVVPVIPVLLAARLFDRFDPGRRRLAAVHVRQDAPTGSAPETVDAPRWPLAPAVLAPSFTRTVAAEARLTWQTSRWLRWPLLLAALAGALPGASAALVAYLLLLVPVLAEAAARDSLAGLVTLVAAQPGARPRVPTHAAAALLFCVAPVLPALVVNLIVAPARAVALLLGLAGLAGFATAAGTLTRGGRLFSGVATAA